MSASRPIAMTLVAGLALGLAACGPGASTASPLPSAAAATPGDTAAPASSAAAGASPRGATALACTAPATPTVAQTEGPYYLAGAPEGADLATDAMPGTRLTFTGFVVDTSCVPIVGAKVETWQADASGAYDNAGFTLRGWVLTDADGRFTIRTVVPGEYPGRTEHIHVKVTPADGATLTTQMYFPGSTANGVDGTYDRSLDLVIIEDGDALIGEHTLVIGG